MYVVCSMYVCVHLYMYGIHDIDIHTSYIGVPGTCAHDTLYTHTCVHMSMTSTIPNRRQQPPSLPPRSPLLASCVVFFEDGRQQGGRH